MPLSMFLKRDFTAWSSVKACRQNSLSSKGKSKRPGRKVLWWSGRMRALSLWTVSSARRVNITRHMMTALPSGTIPGMKCFPGTSPDGTCRSSSMNMKSNWPTRAAGFTNHLMVMCGCPMESSPAGAPIIMADGCGTPSSAGHGSPMIPGDGPSTDMDAGTGGPPWDGIGSRPRSGGLLGCTGITASIPWAGVL